jgi:predicted branched-subunit amino acid permease
MEDRETPRKHKYGESKMTGIMMATVRHVNSGSGRRKFQAAWFLLDRVYIITLNDNAPIKMRGLKFSLAALLEIHAVWDVNAASVGR